MTHSLANVLAVVALAAAAAAPAAPPDADADVTIYRCVAADGQVVIGNLPCARGEVQEVRSMLRPVDSAAPRAVPTPPIAAPAPVPVPVPVRIVAAPPPTYECTRPDGSRYESANGDGEPRWVPHWTSGYPIGIGAAYPGPDSRGDTGARGPTITARDAGLSVPLRSDISIPVNPPRPTVDVVRPRPPRPPPGHGHGHGYFQPGHGGGTWEYDSCRPLPQAEACARLRDRREVLRTRFFNAQQVERDTLRVEERGLDARIDSDCRTY